nr:serine/threonine-protein kinase [Micromonospora sp. DSM 115978]
RSRPLPGSGSTVHGARTTKAWNRDEKPQSGIICPVVGHGVAPLEDSDPRTVGPYTLTGRLGEGGMGSVFLSTAPDGRKVAVKVVRSDLALESEFRVRFLREAHAAQRVARFCTVEVLDVDTEARVPYLVTEYIDGPTLADAVRNDGPLPPAELERTAIAVASALTAIHSAGMIHRDLKPANIM